MRVGVNGIGDNSKVALRRACGLLRWATVPGYVPIWYATSYSGQLGLLPSARRETSTG